jgi:hypothetical protein
MTTETKEATRVDQNRDVEPLQEVIRLLQVAIKSAKNDDVRLVLKDCVKLITDVVAMNHGFGAALKAKYKSG